MVGLLITDTAARPPRATKDVDVTIEIGTLSEFYALDATLRILQIAAVVGSSSQSVPWGLIHN